VGLMLRFIPLWRSNFAADAEFDGVTQKIQLPYSLNTKGGKR
jgi:hypothetical protein